MSQQERAMLECHAAELAEHLRGWDADLARRERALHDQLRAMDRERREFRLWMQQMHCELEAQREALQRRRSATAGDPFELPW